MRGLSIIGVFIGAILQGFAMSVFLFPHDIPSGGAAGLTILIHFLFDVPRGVALWLVNFVFLSLALKNFGYTWTFRTMLSVTISSITVSLTEAYLFIPHIHLLLDFLLGSIIFGIGVGILIRNESSSGGMVIPALMLSRQRGWRPGKVMFWINIFIFLLTAFVIDYKIVLFAIICQWISTTIIDIVYQIKVPFLSLQPVPSRKK